MANRFQICCAFNYFIRSLALHLAPRLGSPRSPRPIVSVVVVELVVDQPKTKRNTELKRFFLYVYYKLCFSCCCFCWRWRVECARNLHGLFMYLFVFGLAHRTSKLNRAEVAKIYDRHFKKEKTGKRIVGFVTIITGNCFLVSLNARTMHFFITRLFFSSPLHCSFARSSAVLSVSLLSLSPFSYVFDLRLPICVCQMVVES